jgi:hypothetical protein
MPHNRPRSLLLLSLLLFLLLFSISSSSRVSAALPQVSEARAVHKPFFVSGALWKTDELRVDFDQPVGFVRSLTCPLRTTAEIVTCRASVAARRQAGQQRCDVSRVQCCPGGCDPPCDPTSYDVDVCEADAIARFPFRTLELGVPVHESVPKLEPVIYRVQVSDPCRALRVRLYNVFNGQPLFYISKNGVPTPSSYTDITQNTGGRIWEYVCVCVCVCLSTRFSLSLSLR